MVHCTRLLNSLVILTHAVVLGWMTDYRDQPITPTVELNALAMKRGEQTLYKPMDAQRTLPYYQCPPNYNYRGLYNQRYAFCVYAAVCDHVWKKVFVWNTCTLYMSFKSCFCIFICSCYTILWNELIDIKWLWHTCIMVCFTTASFWYLTRHGNECKMLLT